MPQYLDLKIEAVENDPKTNVVNEEMMGDEPVQSQSASESDSERYSERDETNPANSFVLYGRRIPKLHPKLEVHR